jgi:hypothetical protein
MENPAKISDLSIQSEAVLVHSKPQGTSQVAASSFELQTLSPEFAGSSPVGPDFNEVNRASRLNRLGAFSFDGLLKDEPANGVIREAGFLFLPSVVVGEGSDSQCEHYPNVDASKRLTSTSQPAFASLLVFSKKATLRRLFKSLQRTTRCGALSAGMLLMSVIGSCSIANAETVSFISSNCIRALVGETEGSPAARIATAECLRNRKSLRGVYGYFSKRISKASPRVWAECELAWAKSASTNLVRGATVWGNKSDVKIFKKKRWFRAYEFVAEYGGHYFYRLKTLRGAK